MKMLTNRLYYLFTMLALIIASIFFLYQQRDKSLNFTCSSQLTIYNESEKIEFLVTLNIVNDKYGFSTMKGYFMDGDKKIYVRIKKEFSLKKEGGVYILFSDATNLTENNIATKPWAKKFLPYFFLSNDNSGKYIIQFKKISDNSLVFLTSKTPTLLCEK